MRFAARDGRGLSGSSISVPPNDGLRCLCARVHNHRHRQVLRQQPLLPRRRQPRPTPALHSGCTTPWRSILQVGRGGIDRLPCSGFHPSSRLPAPMRVQWKRTRGDSRGIVQWWESPQWRSRSAVPLACSPNFLFLPTCISHGPVRRRQSHSRTYAEPTNCKSPVSQQNQSRMRRIPVSTPPTKNSLSAFFDPARSQIRPSTSSMQSPVLIRRRPVPFRETERCGHCILFL